MHSHTHTVCFHRHADRAEVVGILEVIQTTEDMVFGDLVAILSEVLS